MLVPISVPWALITDMLSTWPPLTLTNLHYSRNFHKCFKIGKYHPLLNNIFSCERERQLLLQFSFKQKTTHPKRSTHLRRLHEPQHPSMVILSTTLRLLRNTALKTSLTNHIHIVRMYGHYVAKF